MEPTSTLVLVGGASGVAGSLARGLCAASLGRSEGTRRLPPRGSGGRREPRRLSLLGVKQQLTFQLETLLEVRKPGFNFSFVTDVDAVLQHGADR